MPFTIRPYRRVPMQCSIGFKNYCRTLAKARITRKLICLKLLSTRISNKEADMRRITSILLISVLIGISGCASTQGAKSVKKSGFLGDYSLLKEGQRSTISEGVEDQALWIYKNPAADWPKYTKIQLEPVTIW